MTNFFFTDESAFWTSYFLPEIMLESWGCSLYTSAAYTQVFRVLHFITILTIISINIYFLQLVDIQQAQQAQQGLQGGSPQAPSQNSSLESRRSMPAPTPISTQDGINPRRTSVPPNMRPHVAGVQYLLFNCFPLNTYKLWISLFHCCFLFETFYYPNYIVDNGLLRFVTFFSC